MDDPPAHPAAGQRLSADGTATDPDSAAPPSGRTPDAAGEAAWQFPCPACGARLAYAPGQREIRCAYCGHASPIPDLDAPARDGALAERDLEEWLQRAEDAAAAAPPEHSREIACSGCGARVDLGPHGDADHCPYCGRPAVAREIDRRALPVQALLPFAVAGAEALKLWRKWLAGRWLAPNALKRLARRDSRLDGIYLPYWTYDARTLTQYAGERGDAYYVPVTRTVTRGGKTRTRTTMERRIRWSPAAGTVEVPFNDVLAPGSTTLDEKLAEALEPWDLPALAPYAPEYLAGFKAERYRIGLKEGFGIARRRMEPAIQSAIRRDIGGDAQRVHQSRTVYRDATFKHILLPVWLSSYRFKNRTYQFCVNARSGEVHGSRPWSAGKIAGLVLAILALLAGCAKAYQYWR